MNTPPTTPDPAPSTSRAARKVVPFLIGTALVSAGTVTMQTGFQFIMEPPTAADSDARWIPIQVAFQTSASMLGLFAVTIIVMALVVQNWKDFRDTLKGILKIMLAAVAIPLGYAISSLALTLLAAITIPPVALTITGIVLIGAGAWLTRDFWSDMWQAVKAYWRSLRQPPAPTP